MPDELMTQDEAVSALLAYMFSGAIGSPKGKRVGYALIEPTPTTFSWSAALEDLDGPTTPIDRYLVKIDRQSKEIYTPKPIILSEIELTEAIFTATGHHLASSTRFTDGVLSISYKIIVQESLDVVYVVQLRHHGCSVHGFIHDFDLENGRPSSLACASSLSNTGREETARGHRVGK
ncbi:hypothetical protein AJ80_07013 [Polytolypa hystricis UAMH7299]|uniref:Uncharacterized protein n=1 Tax=Polytolypa hystricis (strain UAMH7299) TaxID=1447883 RepID=A0A2B7XSX9_POLH7|nr:hypothetical protein AJ80_07013 [Polytolypa hystricis UAMH7299]